MSDKFEKAQNSVRRFLRARKNKAGPGKGEDAKHPCDRGDGTLDFDCLLKTKKDTFALFYAEWCPFSMAFLPHFRKHAEGKGRDCVRLTIEEREGLFDKYKVEYMPTVIFFKNGKPAKRLDAAPHVGLTEKQLLAMLASCK